MQSELHAISTRSDSSLATETLRTLQYGSYDLNPDPAVSQREQPGEPAAGASSSAAAGTGNRSPHLRRLSVADRTARVKASAQRISEYEKALSPAPPKTEWEGPAFKVVKNKGHRLDAPQLEKFPNEVLTHILSHLPAASLSSVSLVSRRFYSLVTTPHAWRVAFSRFFPGQDVAEEPLFQGNRRGSDNEEREHLRAEQRFFTRLTGLASWRSEYILRTRLLRSLTRGKPAQLATSLGPSNRSHSIANSASAVVTYNSQLFATINHIEAAWNNGRKAPRFIHGTDETGSACTSDPSIGKVDAWGLTDPQSLPQFTDLFPGDAMYGLGSGQVIGTPNVMSVSQQFGMIYGEGFPGGHAYFRSPEEMRGRFLAVSDPNSDHEAGIPKIPILAEAMCAVWIAKSSVIPKMTEGVVGMLTGSSCGIVTSYSLGADNLRDSRLGRGEITARWMLSPGVPIVAIAADESYNSKRKTSSRIWAVVLNALGEVFYLTDIPRRPVVERGAQLDDSGLARLAWETGRSVYWSFCEPSRRIARPDTYHEFEYDGSYSPRSSSTSMALGRDQIIAETREIEKFIAYRPAHFQRICEGWDMRRKLEVDFGGDDGFGCGENIVVIQCGIGDSEEAQIKRYSRLKVEQPSFDDYPLPKTPPMIPATTSMASLFGGGIVKPVHKEVEPSPKHIMTPERRPRLSHLVEEWRTSVLILPNSAVEITTTAIDMSTFALLTASEDPLLTVGGSNSVSSPFATPATPLEGPAQSLSDVPGHRARFIAVGTKVGSVVIWNVRGPQSTNSTLINEMHPQRTIITDSPQISCLAVSALYIVHGGNDGLVQTWDPLASTMQPLRTLNSRFSSRARRRLVQAEASVQGVGINLYAAGALAIDPDPTCLRGMVSLGTHLRYWSYSSNGADEVSSKKRRLRRSQERGTNSTPDKFTNTGRGALMDYIATEQEELRTDKERQAREVARLRGRFGVDFAGMSEEEAIKYAEMVSQEEFQRDEQRRLSDTGSTENSSSVQSAWSSETVTPEGSITGHSTSPQLKNDDELDHDIEEAIRLSLLEGTNGSGLSPKPSGSGGYEIPFKVKQKKSKRRSASSSPSTSQAARARKKEVVAADDLEFALQLSLAEEESRRNNVTVLEETIETEEFPELQDIQSSGKGKHRAF